MRILIVSLNYAPEPTGIAVYSSGLAETLARRGHEVAVICGNPHYPQWQLFDAYRPFAWTSRSSNGVAINRCPIYIPSKPSGGSRLLHYASFFCSALLPTLSRAMRHRPQIVFTVAPSLMSAPLALAAARLAGARSWLHIQDFEVEAAFATQHLSAEGLVARAAGAFERRMLRAFDRVSSISPEMCRKAERQGTKTRPVYELRNWAELDEIAPQTGSAYRQRWGISTKHVALYSGSIARKQGIEIICDVARRMQERRDLTFVVCGNGPTRRSLEEQAAGLTNIQFHDLQPMQELGELLSLASVHLLPQRAEAADLVLPSKLANMFASGRPVLAGVSEGRSLAREIGRAGLIYPPENADAMAQGLARLLDDPHLHKACASAARESAEQSWSRKSIIDAFELELFAEAREALHKQSQPAGVANGL